MVLVLSIELQICSHVLEQTREMRSCWSLWLSSPGVLADSCCYLLVGGFFCTLALTWNDVCQSSGLLWTSAAEVAPISPATGPKAGLILAQCFAQQCCTQDWRANVTCTSATPECFLSSSGPLRSVFSSDRVYWLPLWCPAWPDAVSVLSGYNSDKTIPSHISLLLGNREMQTCLESLDVHVCVPGLVVWDLQRPCAGLNGQKRICLEWGSCLLWLWKDYGK